MKGLLSAIPNVFLENGKRSRKLQKAGNLSVFLTIGIKITVFPVFWKKKKTRKSCQFLIGTCFSSYFQLLKEFKACKTQKKCFWNKTRNLILEKICKFPEISRNFQMLTESDKCRFANIRQVMMKRRRGVKCPVLNRFISLTIDKD